MTSSLSILSVALSSMTSPSSSSLLFLLGLPNSSDDDDAPLVFALLARGSTSATSSSGADRFRADGAGTGVDGRGWKDGFGNDGGNINAGPSVG